jgi:dihydrofolate synthase/folylpolyglutamate synthase
MRAIGLRSVTYAEATAFLYGLRRFGWRLGLDTVRRLLALVGDPQDRFPTVHIGGTNGKGSTAAILDAILRAAGYRTGLYTSPHLVSFTERIRVDGLPITEAEVTALVAELEALCLAHFAQAPVPAPEATRPPHPTFFELTTAMAFLHFARQRTDVAVVEVGLGGRFDATNVILPRVSVITNVALDHQEYLGQTLAEIAGEKAGIIKAGVPVVTAARGEAYEVIARTARERGAPTVHTPQSYRVVRLASTVAGHRFDLAGPTRHYEGIQLPLAGRHQVENAVSALAAAEVLEAGGLRLGEGPIRCGLAQARWPGRLQAVGERPRILVDGAHNTAGAAALADFLREHRAALHRLVLVFGVLRDKDSATMLGALAPLADHIILTQPPAERGADPRELPVPDRLRPRVEVHLELSAALQRARAIAGPEDTILATGSLYLVGPVLQALGISP